MAVADSEIEAKVVLYVREGLARNEMPNRFNAIRKITGDLDVLPSAVARVITKMIADGSLKHLTNDQLKLVERTETPAAEEPAAAPTAAPAGKGKKKG